MFSTDDIYLSRINDEYDPDKPEYTKAQHERMVQYTIRRIRVIANIRGGLEHLPGSITNLPSMDTPSKAQILMGVYGIDKRKAYEYVSCMCHEPEEGHDWFAEGRRDRWKQDRKNEGYLLQKRRR